MFHFALLLLSFLVQRVQNENCICVPFYLCQDKNKDERYDQCSSYIETCCDFSSALSRYTCGYQPTKVSNRLEREEADFGEFPWMVAIFSVETNENTNYECGGSLIHNRVVLTAAHCVKNRKKYRVRLGQDNQEIDVSIIRIHPKFNAGSYLAHDIALLVLKTKVTLEEHINTICLGLDQSFSEIDHTCFTSGWDTSDFSGKNKKVALKKVDLPLVPHNTCQENLRKTRLGGKFKLHTSFICAGGEKDKDTCKGFGGGPLVCPVYGQQDRFIQVGVVSWGIGCGENSVPGVYANVAEARSWIDKEMKNQNLEIISYQP